MTDYEFGPFRLDPRLGLLSRDNHPTALGQRAGALLGLLLERAGRPATKAMLMEAAWPGIAVEEGNLTVQISTLRKVLDEVGGAGWIETLPRRGYRYIGPPVVRSPLEESACDAFPTLHVPDKPSVAVLPFADLSDEAEQEYLADGMVDDVIAGLSRIRWLFVIGRGSTLSYKGRTVDPKQIGRELGVRYVLEGTVRKVSDRVRVNCRLVDATTGAHEWSERYDRKLDDVFALQDEIASSVLGALEPGLRRAEIERVRRKRPESLDAYELVLRAQPDVDSGMPGQVARALELLERSIELAPGYALAHASAAMCHHCLFLRAGLNEENRAASLRHAEAAITHGHDDAVALTLAGFCIGMDGHDRSTAFAAFEAALRVSPSSALTYILGSVILGWSADAERAIEWAERGMRLSPFDPWTFAALHACVLGHFHRGRHESAAAAARKAIIANPAHSISHMLLAAPLVKLGRLDEAIEAASTVLRLQPNFRYGRQLSGVDCEPALAASLTTALRTAGLPE